MAIRDKKKNPLNKNIIIILIMIILAVYALSLICVLGWGFMSSLKSRIDFKKDPLSFPNLEYSRDQMLKFANYKEVFKVLNGLKFSKGFYSLSGYERHSSEGSYFIYIWNTLLYTGVGCVILAFVPAIGAYMCAKYKFKFSKIQYSVYLLFMMIPIVGAYPAELTLLRNLNLYDTFWGNWIQKLHFSGMYFFVYYAFYAGLSDSYSEAAEIDGASQLSILIRIVIPLSMKMIGSVMLIQFINLWNDYQTPLLYLPTKPTLAYAVYLFTSGQGDGVIGFPNNLKTNYPLQTAACMVLAVPVLIVYIAFNQKLMGDISMGGIKG